MSAAFSFVKLFPYGDTTSWPLGVVCKGQSGLQGDDPII